jgi:hypothetical protein
MGKVISVAHLKDKQLEKIKKLEKKLNICIIAYDVREAPIYSNLSEDDLKEIKEIENLLGISLIAYELKNKKEVA